MINSIINKLGGNKEHTYMSVNWYNKGGKLTCEVEVEHKFGSGPDLGTALQDALDKYECNQGIDSEED